MKWRWQAVERIFGILDSIHSVRSTLHKHKMAECGHHVYIGHYCEFYHDHLHIGNNVVIGDRASFIASVSHIYIGDFVMCGPNVTIRGGNHRIDVVGEYMYDVGAKLPENDQDVVIEDDVWIGCNATILKGVRIGRGAVVAAGAVVTKPVPRYAIVGGNPARLIRDRFTADQVSVHEKLLSIKKQSRSQSPPA